MIDDELTEKIIGSAFEVANSLGCGFLEKVYENALAFELREKGFDVKQQQAIEVLYKNQVVGDYIADLLVNDELIIELKAAKELSDVHKAQIINYLKATGLKVGLLFNFGKPKLEFRRFNNQNLSCSSPASLLNKK